MTDTVLQRIVTKLHQRLDAMVDEDGARLWNNVVEGSVSSLAATYWPAVGIDQGGEETLELTYPFIDKVATFYVDFKFRQMQDVDSYRKFRYYLGRLQARLFGPLENRELDGLSLNVVEVGNNPEIEGKHDTTPGGMLVLRVHYRHVDGDPYRTHKEFNA